MKRKQTSMLSPVGGDIQYIVNILNKYVIYLLLKDGKKGGREESGGERETEGGKVGRRKTDR